MTDEDLERRIRWFDAMVRKAAALHPMTWCAKRGWPVWTLSLKGRECYACDHFIENGGACDPL